MKGTSKIAVRKKWLDEGRCLQCGTSLAKLVLDEGYAFKNCPRCRDNMRAAGDRHRTKRRNQLQAAKEGIEDVESIRVQDYVANLPISHDLVRSTEAQGNVRWARLKRHLVLELQHGKGRSPFAKRVLCMMAAIERGLEPHKVVKLQSVKRVHATKMKREAAAA